MQLWLKIFYAIAITLFVIGFITNKITERKEKERIANEENNIKNNNN